MEAIIDSVQLGLILSQVRNKPIVNAEMLKEKYKSEDNCSKLAMNIKKIYDTPKENPEALSSDELEARQNDLGKLNSLLISFGGSGLRIPKVGEEDTKKIIERGQLWLAHGVKKVKGKPSQCHKNSCLLWEQNKGTLHLATGYALLENGIWIQHSWCLIKNPRSVNVIETTPVKWVAYFGYPMTEEESQEFLKDNF